MATKAQRFRAEEERRKAASESERERSKPDPTTNESERAGKKATYAFEGGTGTRKSTRKSANRSKPDSALTIREEMTRTTPKERHTREARRP